MNEHVSTRRLVAYTLAFSIVGFFLCPFLALVVGSHENPLWSALVCLVIIAVAFPLMLLMISHFNPPE